MNILGDNIDSILLPLICLLIRVFNINFYLQCILKHKNKTLQNFK